MALIFGAGVCLSAASERPSAAHRAQRCSTAVFVGISVARNMAGLSVSMDADTMLQVLSNGLGHPNLHGRLSVLEALGAWLCATEQTCEAVSKPQARILVRLLLSALCNPQYLERLWIVGLNEVIAVATRSERCRMFTPICVVNLAG